VHVLVQKFQGVHLDEVEWIVGLGVDVDAEDFPAGAVIAYAGASRSAKEIYDSGRVGVLKVLVDHEFGEDVEDFGILIHLSW
jgi:hypothetical protein